MKRIVFLLIFCAPILVVAQQPFKDYGYKVKIATLSDGKYVEFFDQDSLIQIGSVVMNRLTGRIVAFVEYDTVYRESDLNPELISRWYSPDPLADQFYNESPYNFCHSNPIKFVDPDGKAPLDDYYSLQGRYLGSDGAKTNNVRLIDATEFMDIRDNNGGTTSAAATSDLQENSALVTIQEPENGVSSELKQGKGENEKGVFAVLDTKEATLSYQKIKSFSETPGEIQFGVASGPGDLKRVPGTDKTQIIVGMIHSHPDPAGLSDADRQVSNNLNAPVAIVDPSGITTYNRNQGDRTLPAAGTNLLRSFLEVAGKKPQK